MLNLTKKRKLWPWNYSLTKILTTRKFWLHLQFCRCSTKHDRKFWPCKCIYNYELKNKQLANYTGNERSYSVCLPSNKICLILGSSSLSPQHNRLQMEGLGWGTNTLMFFQDSVTFSLRSPTLVTLAITFVPGPSYFVLKTTPLLPPVAPGITALGGLNVSTDSSCSMSEGLPESSILVFSTAGSSDVSWFTAQWILLDVKSRSRSICHAKAS